jgi:glycerol-3-phosphate acyltransferase PlsY
VAAVALVVAAYLLGMFPTAALVGRRSGFDPTVDGSHNPGASNALRLGGRKAGALVLAGDMAKGALSAGVGLLVGGRPLAVACGVAAVVGHVLPVTRLRGGGKGVASAAGMLLVVEPAIAAVCAVVWVVGFACSRIPAVASIAACVVVVAALVVVGRPAWEIAALGGACVVLVVRHGGNLSRLRRGEERPVDVQRATRRSRGARR